MGQNLKDSIVSKEAQKIVAKKLSSDQLFVLLVLVISAVLLYFMMGKITSQMDEVNTRLDKLIDLNGQNLNALRNHLKNDDERDKQQ